MTMKLTAKDKFKLLVKMRGPTKVAKITDERLAKIIGCKVASAVKLRKQYRIQLKKAKTIAGNNNYEKADIR